MQKVGAEAARRRLPELLDRAHAGEASIILKRGIPYAALVALDQQIESRGKGGLLSLRGTGAGLWEHKATEVVAAYRREWE